LRSNASRTMRPEPAAHPSRRRCAPPQDEAEFSALPHPSHRFNFQRAFSQRSAGPVVAARATPSFPASAGTGPFSFPLERGWSAGRRQGVCETPLAGLAIGPPERLRGVPPRLKSGRRLPALHLRHRSRAAGRDQHKCDFSSGDKFIFGRQFLCHARPCAGHLAQEGKAFLIGMAGTSPAMTRRKYRRLASLLRHNTNGIHRFTRARYAEYSTPNIFSSRVSSCRTRR